MAIVMTTSAYNSPFVCLVNCLIVMAAELQPLEFAVCPVVRCMSHFEALADRVLQIAQAVQRAVLLAKRESVFFPLNKAYSLPHPIDGYWGAAKVMLRPAADGAGVIAGAPL